MKKKEKNEYEDLYLPDEEYRFTADVMKKIGTEREREGFYHIKYESGKSKKTEENYAEKTTAGFDLGEAREVYMKAKGLLESVKKVLTEPEDWVLSNCAGLYRDEELRLILSRQPIEEINRDKLGIRVAALRSAGITNLAQITSYSYQKLTSISGIGGGNATKILAESAKLAEYYLGTIKLDEINLQNRFANNLLVECCKFLRLRYLYRTFKDEFSGYRGELETRCLAAAPASGKIRWFFTFSGSKKLDAVIAISELKDFMTQRVADSINTVSNNYDIAMKTTVAEAQADYIKNKSSYVSVVKQLAGNTGM